MTGSEPREYQFPKGHHLVRCCPVEGEPFVECWFGEEVWGQVQIAGVDHDATGEARLADCEFIVSLYGRGSDSSRWWEFSLADVRDQLAQAESLLRDNELGRQPIADDGLTAAGLAVTGMGAPEEFGDRR